MTSRVRTESVKNLANTNGFDLSGSEVDVIVAGNSVGKITSNGIVNGTPFTTRLTLAKTTSGALTRLASPTSDSSTTSTTYVSSGIGFSYTPIASGSRIKVTIQISYTIAFSGATGSHRIAYHRFYSDTTSVPNLSASIPGTSTQLGVNENITGGCFNDGTTNYYNRGTLHRTFEYTFASSAIQYFYIGIRNGDTSCDQTLHGGTSNYNATYLVEEYI